MDWTVENAATRLLGKASERVDDFLALGGTWYLERTHRKVRARAALMDARYAEIQETRKTNTAGLLMLSGPDLGWEEWEYQMAVESAVHRHSWIDAIALWSVNRPFGRGFGNFIAKQQRRQRGWDFRDLYSLDHHVASTLGPQLLELADRMPNRDSDWLDELRAAGQALICYAEKDEVLGAKMPPMIGSTVEAQITDGAKEAMHWVAANLMRLSV